MNRQNCSNNGGCRRGDARNGSCNKNRRECDVFPCTVIEGPQGPVGKTGMSGPRGPRGERGEPGGMLDYADFYALMPPDNGAPIGEGETVMFPRDGVITGGINRLSNGSFNLQKAGTYHISVSLSLATAGQLVLTLNGTELNHTVMGSAAGGQLSAGVLITTASENSVITLRVPTSGEAVTLAPFAGGSNQVAAHIVITRYSTNE